MKNLPLTSYNQSMGVRHDWPILTGILQKALDSIPETERDAIMQKWISIKYEHGFDYSLLWKILVPGLIVLSLLFYWNRRLTREVHERTRAERALERARDELESRVEERTAGIARANRELREEIQERERAEMALRESEEKYRLLVEHAGDAIFVAQDQAVKFPNPKALELLCYSAEELLSMPFTDFIHPQDRSLALDLHERRLSGEELPGSSSFRAVNQKGQVLMVELSAVLITWEGRPATLYFLRDLTNQRELETQLRQAQKMEAIGTLAGGIAHDFNNILTAILGYAEILSFLHIEKDSPARPHLDGVLKAASRASDLVQQILAFSRQTEQETKPLLLEPIVGEAVRFLRAVLPATIEIRRVGGGDKARVLADPSQMHQVIMNLCTNAAHAMKDSGGVLGIGLEEIELSSRDVERLLQVAPGPYAKLTVTDTGHGIPRDVLEKIFDPYYTTKKPGEGTGLGLAMVHGIVKSQGGMITVDSEPGKGTTFEVLLPRLTGKVISSTTEADGRLPGGNERILFIDDEESIVEIAKIALETLGYEVVGATNGTEALDTFQSGADEFHLVITDLIMPEMTGIQLAEQLMRAKPGVPIILSSGFGDMRARTEAKARGIREFISKPITLRSLSRIIREVLDQEREG